MDLGTLYKDRGIALTTMVTVVQRTNDYATVRIMRESLQ